MQCLRVDENFPAPVTQALRVAGVDVLSVAERLPGAADEVVLAAQALCLEEMTGHPVAEGALYYASSRRRRAVPITDALRVQVAGFAGAVCAMLTSGELLPPTTDVRRCKNCSLRDRCQPEAVSQLRRSGTAASVFDPDA